jgi:hypothetical protein
MNNEKLISGIGYGELLLTAAIHSTVPVSSGTYLWKKCLRICIRYLKKLQGSYENSSSVWKDLYTRIWITARVNATSDGMAMTESDLLSPGSYHAKIFGDAAKNVSSVDLTMTVVKKLVVNGHFNFRINTTGFPDGDYLFKAKALNGTFNMDEISMEV